MKLNKKYISMLCGVGVAVVAAVAVKVGNKNNFDPSAFDNKENIKTNDSSFLDGKLTKKDKDKGNKNKDNEKSGSNDEQKDDNNNSSDNSQSFSEEKRNFDQSYVHNVVAKVLDRKEEKNSIPNDLGNILAERENDTNILVPNGEGSTNPILWRNPLDYVGGNKNSEIRTSSEGSKSGRGNSSSSGGTNNSGGNNDGNQDNNGGGNSGGNNGGGNTTPDTPSEPDTPSTPDTPSEPDTPSKPDIPSPPDRPNEPDIPSEPDTPNEPDTVPTLPSGIFENMFDVKKFPSSSGSSSGGSSGSNDTDTGIADGGNLTVDTNSFGDDFDYVYSGQKLDDWRLLCSMYVYYSVNDELYRISEVDKDYFYFGSYPEFAQEDFELDVYFRANKKAEWIKKTVTIKVVDYKVIVKAPDGSNLYEKTMSEGESVDLLPYYGKIQSDLAVEHLFIGWNEKADFSSELIRTSFTPTEKGRTILYAMPYVELDSNYQIIMDMDYGIYFPNRLQTLVGYLGSEDIVNIPEGIQCISLYQSIKNIIVSSSVLEIMSDNWGYYCEDSYEVAEDNLNYSSKDGVLYNKDKTIIYDIPLNKKEITVDENVTVITLKDLNNIEKITFNSLVPPDIDVSLLNNAELIVPDDAYFTYLMAYGNTIGNNTLKTANNAEDNYDTSGDFISSKDKKIIYSVKKGRSSIVYMPEEAETLKEGAFSNNKYSMQIVVFGENIKSIEDNAFKDSSIDKLIFKGTVPPEINENSFNEGTVVYVPEGLRQTYIDSWKEVLGQEACEALISPYTALIHKDNSGSDILSVDKEDILIKIGDIGDSFDESYAQENGLNLVEISNYAFYNCYSLTSIELPESVKKIGDFSFSGCINLKLGVINSKDNIIIGFNAFENCNNLMYFASNAMNASFLNDYYMFVLCLYAPANADGYGYNWSCWDGRYYMTTIDGNKYLYGEDVSEEGIASRFVRGTLLNNGNVEFLENTKEIGPYSFESCENVEEIILPDTLEIISEGAFSGSGIKNIVIPENVYSIGAYTFDNCTELERVDINSTALTELNEYLFYDCSKLKEVNFCENSNISEIRYYAFAGCDITEITLPSLVTRLYNNIFPDNAEFITIKFTSEQAPHLVPTELDAQFTFTYYGDNENFRVVVPEGCEDNYINHWKYDVFGYEDGNMPADKMLEGENIVRGWLGLEPVEGPTEATTEDTTELTTEESTEESTEETSETVTDIFDIPFDLNGEKADDNSSSSEDNKATTEVTTEEITEATTEATTEGTLSGDAPKDNCYFASRMS